MSCTSWPDHFLSCEILPTWCEEEEEEKNKEEVEEEGEEGDDNEDMEEEEDNQNFEWVYRRVFHPRPRRPS